MHAMQLLIYLLLLLIPSSSSDDDIARWRRGVAAGVPHASACLGLSLFRARRTDEAMPLLMAAEDWVSSEYLGGAFGMMARKLATLPGHAAHEQEREALTQSVVHFTRAAARRRNDTACSPRALGMQPRPAKVHKQKCTTAFAQPRATVLRSWGDALAWLGRGADAARVWRSAEARALWPDPLCRAVSPLPERRHGAVAGRYIFDASAAGFAHVATPVARTLLPALCRELSALAAAGGVEALPWRAEAAGLHRGVKWSALVLRANGRAGAACETNHFFPATCALLHDDSESSLLRRVPALDVQRGQVKLSRMEPGAVVRPHSGPSNARLRMHCAVDLPPPSYHATPAGGTYLRVGTERRAWRGGECFVFREDCEHEVRIARDLGGPRVVLIIDFASPRLRDADLYAGAVRPGSQGRARREFERIIRAGGTEKAESSAGI